VDHVLDTVPGDIVLGIPLGIGKPNPSSMRCTAASRPTRRGGCASSPRCRWKSPVGKSDLEQHFLEPLVERVFGDYPDLDYVKDLRGRRRCRPTSRCASSS
jgi:hypothetical protein